MRDYLLDDAFLSRLNQEKRTITYAKITALTLDEKPIEEIQGKVTGGSINIDGASAVRRTCSLSLIADNITITDFYWGLSNKFKIEIGLENHISEKYPDIIWFPQGTYAITSFSASRNVNNYNISINGKDKMSYLNGDISGTFTAKTDINHWEEIDESGHMIKRELPIAYIIKDLVHKYGNELFSNIIINDLADYGLELLEYKGEEDKPLIQLVYCKDGVEYEQISTVNFSNDLCYYFDGVNYIEITFHDPELAMFFEQSPYPYIDIYDSPVENEHQHHFHAYRYQLGEAIGYRGTDLIYPKDLTANVGESVMSVLDKIKNMLGDFEYFYDLEGHFIFQRKKTYLNTKWQPIVSLEYTDHNDFYVSPLSDNSKYSYSFTNEELISAISNQPQLNNVKNDFCVWGTKKGVGGGSIPIHMRYSINKKPTYYISVPYSREEAKIEISDNHNPAKSEEALMQVPTFYFLNNYEIFDLELQKQICIAMGWEESKEEMSNFILKHFKKVYDWREILFQMAKDYLKHNHCENFNTKLIYIHKPLHLYQDGTTTYEPYYEDMLGFWRLIYNPEASFVITQPEITFKTQCENILSENLKVDLETRKAEFLQAYFAVYGTHPKEMLIKSEGMNDAIFEDMLRSTIVELEEREKIYNNFYHMNNENVSYRGWAKIVNTDPSQLLFWIDFLDSDYSEISQFSVQAIGCRTKTVNDSKVKAIVYREVPNFIYYLPKDKAWQERMDYQGYKFVQILPQVLNLLATSDQGKTAKSVIDDWLYQYAFGTTSMNLTTIPIYYLEPNTRIAVKNMVNHTTEDYIVNKITVPLVYNGTMTISAVKAVDRLY